MNLNPIPMAIVCAMFFHENEMKRRMHQTETILHTTRRWFHDLNKTHLYLNPNRDQCLPNNLTPLLSALPVFSMKILYRLTIPNHPIAQYRDSHFFANSMALHLDVQKVGPGNIVDAV